MRKILLAASLAAATTCGAADEQIPIESFFKLAQYSAMAISPDGVHIAALAPVNGRQNLVVLDLEHKKGAPLTQLGDRDIVFFAWLNSKRLLVQTGKLGVRDDDARGGGLYAVDVDGSNDRRIAEGGDELAFTGIRTTFTDTSLVRTLPDSDDIIAVETLVEEHKVTPGALVRINTRSARRTNVSGTKPDAGDNELWVADNKGVARAFVAQSNSKVRIWYRAGENAPWVKLDEFGALSEGQWQPLALAEDDKTLLVGSHRGHDKEAIVRYDPEKKTFGEVVASHPQVDLSTLVDDPATGAVVGVLYDADRAGVAWFDEKLASVQVALDKALAGAVNGFSWSNDRQRFVIRSRSDVNPGSFYYFDRANGKLQWLADRMPWIDPKKMSPMTPVRYKARDGLEIPAYLTIPRGSSGKNLPMVAVIHGGPWIPGDEWGFDREVQFLASRGYAVLQPNYRGTTRYGWKHFTASFKQWGLAMQDDITDGVQWAIEQGYRRFQTRLHLRGKLWRLRDDDGRDQDARPIQVRHQLRGRHRPRPLRDRDVVGLRLLAGPRPRDEGHVRRYRERRGATQGHVPRPSRLPHQGAGDDGLRRGRRARGARARHAHEGRHGKRGTTSRVDDRRGRGPRLSADGEPGDVLRSHGKIPRQVHRPRREVTASPGGP